MDYKALLHKYMRHVVILGGVTFVGWSDGEDFSEAEDAELRRLADDLVALELAVAARHGSIV